MDVSTNGVIAWAFSNVAVDDPSDPESNFNEHTDCELQYHRGYLILTKHLPVGFFGIDYSSAHNANYQNYLNGNAGGSSTTTTTKPSSTTTSTTTSPTVSVSGSFG